MTINLTQGYITIIDEEDFEKVSKYKWHIRVPRKHGKIYAQTSIHISGSGINRKKQNIKLHRLIMNVNDSNLHIDHINGNTLDNRKCNLRICNNSQNHQNIPKTKKQSSSKYKGVCKRKDKWRATIRVLKKHIELGSFDSELEAAKAYDKAAIKFFKEFANINFKDGNYGQ